MSAEDYCMTRILKMALPLILLALGLACTSVPRKSDAELGLDPVQARGRHVFDARCAECHEAYSSSGRRGPSLKAMFKKPYLPSGTPANDDRVREVIILGRAKMPGYSRVLSPDQVDDLIRYLHTL
jgi:mono/diheme cytochrome c family protein